MSPVTLTLVCVLVAQTTPHRARIQAADGLWIDVRNGRPTQVLKCQTRPANTVPAKKSKK